MAIKSEYIGGASDWEDGEVLNATDLLDTINTSSSKIISISTTTDLNITTGQSKNVEFAISAEDLIYAKYITIKINGKFQVRTGPEGGESTITALLQAKSTTTGSYSNLINTTVLENQARSSSYQYSNNNTINNLEHTYLLSVDDKNEGVTFKITLTSTAGSGGSGSFVNRQIIFEKSA